ncbi:Smr-domain-containing protein [Rozella allomycis CSF55]|uniref:Smr-domain-containing protein n=1 Tax=Rozella allomycis (strain CSF55) TaxID=988480 RepID=A0A075AZL6_ROZAC|nr:hypothetical protein O9G_005408 [Rozella allomycis CSF55]RKP20063.1 Smr-domain-containing protein [Rozella allomycis CSF55]|eukprot:EPZ35771.1 hypothetical protein O9G_005408 [Rozella allomycis CSF55]
MGSIFSRETEGDPDELRLKARLLKEQAMEYGRESQVAYLRGDKSTAHSLSVQKKELYKKANDMNSKAMKKYIETNNQDNSKTVLDLHGLHVHEAIETLEKRVSKLCSKAKVDDLYLYVITGKGNNSANGIVKLRPAVLDWAERNNEYIEFYEVDSRNSGQIILKLRKRDTFCVIL